MRRVVAHARRDAADADARLGARVPERPISRRRAEHPVPDPAELRERDVHPRPLPLAGGVDAAVEVVEAGEDGLDHPVAGGGVRAEAVDVSEEEVARVRGGGGEGAEVGEDDLCGGLEVRFAVSWTREGG